MPTPTAPSDFYLFIRDLIERAIRTFIGAFTVTWAASDYEFTKVVLVSAAMAGVSAAMALLTKGLGSNPATASVVAPPYVEPGK